MADICYIHCVYQHTYTYMLDAFSDNIRILLDYILAMYMPEMSAKQESKIERERREKREKKGKMNSSRYFRLVCSLARLLESIFAAENRNEDISNLDYGCGCIEMHQRPMLLAS